MKLKTLIIALALSSLALCSCGTQSEVTSQSGSALPEIDLNDFTDVVVWEQGLDETFNRFTHYVLEQYIIENACSVSRQKEDGNYVLIIDGSDTDCKITFKGASDTSELDQILVESPCDTDTNTNAFFVACGSMLSACFDKKYSSEYGMKYFCQMLENITEESPMQVAQFEDTKLSATSSNVGINFCIQHVSEDQSDQNAEPESNSNSSSQSGNDKLMEAWKNRDSDSSSGTGGNGTGGSSLSESYLRGKAKQEAENTPGSDPEPAPAPAPASSPTLGQQNALSSAKDYVDMAGFSYTGLIGQLEYEGYSHEESVYGADNCGADWNAEAAESAKDYMDMTAFSRQGLIDQLLYEGFTQGQAEYGATSVGY